MHLNFDELQEHVYGDRRFDHVELCSECRAKVSRLERERELFDAWGRNEIRPARPRRRLWYVAAAVAAAAILLAWPRAQSPVVTGEVTVRDKRMTTSPAQQGLVRISPKSTVTLRPDSEVLVETEQRVQMTRGRALFHVSGPFEVRTAAAIVRVLGTIFDVAVDPKGTRVHVIEGRVQVGEFEIGPGEELYVHVNAEPPQDSAENLYRKAVDQKNLDDQIRWYARALERAQAKQDVEYIIRAGFQLGRCYELKLQETEAMNAYAVVAAQKADKDDLKWLVNRADELGKRRGVQMHLDQFARTVRDLRATEQMRRVPEEEEKTWASIASKGPRACYGLIQALDASEVQVKTLIANRLKTLIDAPGIATLIEKLASKPHRDGASTALREILLQFNRARELDAAADQAEWELSFIGPGVSEEFGEKVDERRGDLHRETVEALRRKADAMRYNLPRSLAVPDILEALRKVILDPTIDETTRSEALMVLTSLDSIGKADVDAALAALDDPHPRVRQSAAGIAWPDHRLVAKLVERVNDEADLVRHQAVLSLGRIGSVGSIPALIEALDDPSHHVRKAAQASLAKIVEPINPADVRAWWNETRGADLLVTRFDTLVRQWTHYHPNDLCVGFHRKLRFARDPVKEQERFEAARARFESLKEFHKREVISNAPPDLLIRYLSGRLREDPYWALQLFVAECLAEMLADVSEIRDMVRGARPQTTEVRAGCIYVLAFRNGDDRDVLEDALLDGDARIRAAACFGLGRIGDPRSAAQLLPRVRVDRPEVRTAAARAIGQIAARHPTLFQDAEFVREFASADAKEEVCFALGEAGHPNSISYLRRLRVDADERVRFAAAWALARIGGNAGDVLWDMYLRAESYLDREGAALGIGDVKDSSKLVPLCDRLFREPNPKVRAAIAESLGKIGVRSILVRDALLAALDDSTDMVRRAAWSALNVLCEGKLPRAQVREFVENQRWD